MNQRPTELERGHGGPARSTSRTAVKLAAALTVVLSVSGCSKYELDRQMEALCMKDGGVKVYETVTLSPVAYDALSKFKVTAKSNEDYYGPDYRYVSLRDVLVGKGVDTDYGRGQLAREYEAIFRKPDERLLGESVAYSRAGGDGFTFGFMPSANRCPRPRVSLQQSVFLKGE
jgi:hypothetical protein